MKKNQLESLRKRAAVPAVVIGLLFTCFTLSPQTEAVVRPPDGGYPGFNTAEGQNALLNLTTGSANTAVGWFSLKNITTGSFNTGLGAGTLVLNTGDENTAVGTAALFPSDVAPKIWPIKQLLSTFAPA